MGKPITGPCINCGQETGQHIVITPGRHSGNPKIPYRQYQEKQYFHCPKCEGARRIGWRKYLNARNIK